MTARDAVLLAAMAAELAVVAFCLLRRSRPVPARGMRAALAGALLFATGWVLLFPQMEPVRTTGPHGVSRMDDFFVDEGRPDPYADDGRARELTATLWYPQEASLQGSCPLVVFSHGSFGVRSSNESLYRELASNGYVVCAIDHPSQCLRTRLSDGSTVWLNGEFMEQVAADDPSSDPAQTVVHVAAWMDVRTKDLDCAIDTVLGRAAEAGDGEAPYRLVDGERVAVAGHSLGGSAALGIGRMRDDVSAAIALEAPFLCDIEGIDDAGRFLFDDEPYPVPVLNVYSDASWGRLREWEQYAENARLLDDASGNADNAHLGGVGHLALTDLSLTTPFLTALLDGIAPVEAPQETLGELNALCLGFLDEHLRKA